MRVSRFIASLTPFVLIAGCQHDAVGPASNPAAIQGPNHSQIVITQILPLSGEPYGVAISSRGQVYVARVIADLVAHTPFSNPAFGANIQIAPGDSFGFIVGPVHVAFNPTGAKAYVVNQFAGTLSVIDAVRESVTASITLGDAGFNVGVAPNGQRVYATTSGGKVVVISTSTNTVVDSMQVGTAANGLAFSPDGATLYVSSRDAGTVTAFSTSSDGLLATYTVGGRPQRLAVSPNGKTLFAANEDSGLSVVSVPSGTVLPAVHLVPSGYGLGQSPDGTQLWVTDPQNSTVYFVDEHTLSTAATFFLGEGSVPRNVAFTTDGSGAVVSDGNGSVFFFQITN
ncbi:MAG TPA: YncE family protein [Gemmatimonadales bacterium]|jgi:YVTN family beta-propeller protein|nr:YncE family protein [Gemmatimonadales bacterium]